MYKRNGASYNFSGGKITNKRNIVLFGLVIMGAGLLSGKAHATDASLTITVSSSNVTANVAPASDSTGTFIQSNPINVGVSTNNATGYTLAIKANDATHPDRLINSTDNSYLSSISTATNLATFKATDLSSITTSGGNQGIWGYLPSKLNSTANANFLPSPGTAGNTIDETSSANSTAINYTIALGAKVSPLATLGAYTNSFMVTVVANPIPYTISYSENTVSGMPDNVISGSSEGTTVTISSTTPTRDGYRFLGWCDQATTKSGDTDTCATGHSHQPGDTISLNQTGANNIKLYAMWEEVTYLQNLTADKCTSTISTAIDARDGTEYHIQRLADDKCWMLDNLALDLTNSNIVNSLSSSNTNIPSADESAILTSLKSGNRSAGNQYATAGLALADWGSSQQSFSVPMVRMSYKNAYPQGTDDPLKDQTKNEEWKYGGYYNYCAATAGSYCYGSGTSYGTSSGNATADICPKGWRLPTGNTSGEFQNLYSEYSSASPSQDTAFRTALRLPLSGYFYNGSAPYNQGSRGDWWSSARIDDLSMYGLYATTSSISPATHRNRDRGYSVRCVLGS